MHKISSDVIIFVFILIVAFLSYFLIFLNKILSRFINKNNVSSRQNEIPFECGLNPTKTKKQFFSVNYFLVGLAFLIFELEGMILIPWAINFWELGKNGMIVALIFIIILLLGLFYALAKGILNYE